jgi:hypothetical protein
MRAPRLAAHATAPCSSARATPRCRYAGGTKKQTTDHSLESSGVSSTGFITGERASLRKSRRGPSVAQPTAVRPA